MQIGNRYSSDDSAALVTNDVGEFCARHHQRVIRIVAVAAILAIAGAADQRSAPRSDRRDQAHAQRGRTKAPARSASSRQDFQRLHPCPSTGQPTGACPGYVVDHIIALKRGGLDEPSNMQWQSVAEAKAKDRIE
jgi:hypothetical protein